MSLAIPRAIVTEDHIKTIEKKLYIEKERDSNKTVSYYRPEKIPFFKVINKTLRVPFFWGCSFFGKRFIMKDELETEFHLEGELRPEQANLKEEAMNCLLENHTVLCSCYPGFGKTILALHLIKELKKPTLIIVNKLVLLKQWEESIQKFMGFTPTIIRGKNSKITPNRLYIINAINIPKHTFENLNIGTLIVDECHLILTTVFSKGLFHICPSYLIGLSATPFRVDGFDVLFDIFFGMYRMHRKLCKEHQVFCIRTNEKVPHTLDKFGKINWNSVIDYQSKSPFRQRLISKYCMEYPDRNILILCKRIHQIQSIFDALTLLNQNVEMFKENDVSFNQDCRILVATFQKCGTGFSFDKLDMLILAVDVKDFFLQYLGRVFRTIDVKPIVIDIVDDHVLLKNHFRERKQIYTESGGKITSVKHEHDEFKTEKKKE